jgi:hypothetical protein
MGNKSIVTNHYIYRPGDWQKVGWIVMAPSSLFVFTILMVIWAFQLGTIDVYSMMMFIIILLYFFLDQLRFFIHYINGVRKEFIVNFPDNSIESKQFEIELIEKIRIQIGAKRTGFFNRGLFDYLHLIQTNHMLENPSQQFIISVYPRLNIVRILLSNKTTEQKDRFDIFFDNL